MSLFQVSDMVISGIGRVHLGRWSTWVWAGWWLLLTVFPAWHWDGCMNHYVYDFCTGINERES